MGAWIAVCLTTVLLFAGFGHALKEEFQTVRQINAAYQDLTRRIEELYGKHEQLQTTCQQLPMIISNLQSTVETYTRFARPDLVRKMAVEDRLTRLEVQLQEFQASRKTSSK